MFAEENEPTSLMLQADYLAEIRVLPEMIRTVYLTTVAPLQEHTTLLYWMQNISELESHRVEGMMEVWGRGRKTVCAIAYLPSSPSPHLGWHPCVC